jgi:hypothetical protein
MDKRGMDELKCLLDHYNQKYMDASDLYKMAERLDKLEGVNNIIDDLHYNIEWKVTSTSAGGIKQERFTLQLRHIKTMLADVRHELRTTLKLEYGREIDAS